MIKERVILGENCIYSFDPEETGLNRNVAVVGGPGSGKTVSFGEAEHIETLKSQKPVIRFCVATKPKIERKYAPAYAKRGFQVYSVNFTDPYAGNSFPDLLKYLGRLKQKTLSVLHLISGRLLKKLHRRLRRVSLFQ